MSKLISFDVSSISTGWALFKENKLNTINVITIDSKYSLQEKLFYFKKNIESLLLIHKPNIVIVEETYLKNVKTLKTLVQFMTVINIVSFELLCLPIVFVNPNTVRSYYKLKTKEDVFKYVVNKYKIKFKKYNFENGNDMSDAVLQGLYWIEKFNKKEE